MSMSSNSSLARVRNVRPEGRDARKQMANREQLEKMRLRERREGYSRYEENTGISQPKESLGHITEAERFVTNAAAEEKISRDASFAKREMMHYGKRVDHANREQKRWMQIEQENTEDEGRWQSWRETGERSRRNKSSVPYNPINLRYNEGKDGVKLKYIDEQVQHRSAVRAETLRQHMCRDGYNPITGADAAPIHIPHVPKPPWER